MARALRQALYAIVQNGIAGQACRGVSLVYRGSLCVSAHRPAAELARNISANFTVELG